MPIPKEMEKIEKRFENKKPDKFTWFPKWNETEIKKYNPIVYLGSFNGYVILLLGILLNSIPIIIIIYFRMPAIFSFYFGVIYFWFLQFIHV